jgi:hypothetical protein
MAVSLAVVSDPARDFKRTAVGALAFGAAIFHPKRIDAA